MKTMITMLVFALASVSSAFASAEVECVKRAQREIRDMSDYSKVELCRRAINTVPVDCYLGMQKIDRNFGAGDLLLVCAGVSDYAPLECVRTAKSNYELRRIENLSPVAELCAYASNNEPVSCYEMARSNWHAGLSIHRSVALCRGTTSTYPVECFKTAKKEGRLDELEAIRLCARY